MLGYDISWAAFNIIEVMSASKFTFKVGMGHWVWGGRLPTPPSPRAQTQGWHRPVVQCQLS